MSEWIDVFIYATLIVALWFVLPTWSSRFTAAFVADRNPEWLSSHPEFSKKLTGCRYPWAYYVWGILSLAVLLSFQVGVWPATLWPVRGDTSKWEVLKDVNSTLLFPGIIWFLGAGLVFSRWLQKTVPLAERRQATLEPRSIDDYVPRGLRMATYGLVGIVLSAWLMAGLLQWYSTPIFWGRFALLVALTPTFAFFVRLSVNRRPNALDRVFGAGFRAGEIRYGFAMHLLPPVIGVARLYEEVADTHLVDVIRALHLGVALIIIVWATRVTTYVSGRGDQGVGRRSRTMKSPAIVVFVAAMTVLGSVDAWAQETSSVPSDAEIRQIGSTLIVMAPMEGQRSRSMISRPTTPAFLANH